MLLPFRGWNYHLWGWVQWIYTILWFSVWLKARMQNQHTVRFSSTECISRVLCQNADLYTFRLSFILFHPALCVAVHIFKVSGSNSGDNPSKPTLFWSSSFSGDSRSDWVRSEDTHNTSRSSTHVWPPRKAGITPNINILPSGVGLKKWHEMTIQIGYTSPTFLITATCVQLLRLLRHSQENSWSKAL